MSDYEINLRQDWANFRKEVSDLFDKGMRSAIQIAKETGGDLQDVLDALTESHRI